MACRLTPRSSDAPTAGRRARAGGTRHILASPGPALSRWRRPGSDVRRRAPDSAVLPQAPYIVAVAIVGAGLMTGLLFAFSLVVMRALRELDAPTGMRAMQRINVLIVRPLFLLVFLGTAALSLVVMVAAWNQLPAPEAALLLAGAGAYLIGPLGVTMAFNIPLNNRLAATPPAQAEVAWPAYAAAWLRWNHVRTALGCAAIALLSLGLVEAR